jgi:hypothetical protein
MGIWLTAPDALRQFRNYMAVYRRYFGLFFCVCVDAIDNELEYLEAIHLLVRPSVRGLLPSGARPGAFAEIKRLDTFDDVSS